MHSIQYLRIILVGFILLIMISVKVKCEINDQNENLTNFLDDQEETSVFASRSFGHHFLKRISFALIPAAFVIGVITTLLAALTVVSIKGLGVGVILLVLAVGQIIARSFPPSANTYSQPIPIVYSQHRANDIGPVWVEKDW